MSDNATATAPRTNVTYDDMHGQTRRYTFCNQHRPDPIADDTMRNVRTESTNDPCSLGCAPRLNWRV